MKTNRRGFFKTLGLGAGAVALALTSAPKAIAVKRAPPKSAPSNYYQGHVVAKMETFADGSMTVLYEIDGKPFCQVNTKPNGDSICTDFPS